MEYSEKVLLLIDKYITGEITEVERNELNRLIEEMPELEQEIVSQEETIYLIKEGFKEYEKSVSKKFLINSDSLSEVERSFLESRRGNARFESRLKLYEETLKRIAKRELVQQESLMRFSLAIHLPSKEKIDRRTKELYNYLTSVISDFHIIITDPSVSLSAGSDQLSEKLNIEVPIEKKLEMLKPIVEDFKQSDQSEMVVFFGNSKRISLSFTQENLVEEIMEQLTVLYPLSKITEINFNN